MKALKNSITEAENSKLFDNIIIMGDINITLINRENNIIGNYINHLVENNIRTLSNNITRPNKNKEGTIIDHIYIKN